MSEETLRSIFAKNLNYYMEKRDKNQTDLYRFLNVSSATASDWCNGHKMPRADKIQSIANWLGIGIGNLMEDRNQQIDDHYYLNDETRQIAQEAFENPELRTLFKVARDIPPERLKAHIDFMRKLKEQERGNNDEGC